MQFCLKLHVAGVWRLSGELRTRPRAIPLTMITMRKSIHLFPLLSYGFMLGGTSVKILKEKNWKEKLELQAMSNPLYTSFKIAVVVVCTRPRAIPLAIITMRKTIHGFPFLSYGVPLRDPSGRWSFAKKLVETRFFVMWLLIEMDKFWKKSWNYRPSKKILCILVLKSFNKLRLICAATQHLKVITVTLRTLENILSLCTKDIFVATYFHTF